jgi:hypothetical protein
MSYRLNWLQETRFSRKILVGKVRRHVPAWIYKSVIFLRYMAFPARCRDLEMPAITYSDGSWVKRKTTDDLSRIQTFLSAQDGPLDIFQAGIGNSSLFRVLDKKLSRLVGVTIAEEEIAYAKEQWPAEFGKKYVVHLTNKYTGDLAALAQGFDFIVDNDISSYACCHHHFHQMLDSYKTMLNPNGAILVGFLGLGYFDSGFGMTEDMLRHISLQHGLSVERGALCYFLKRA